MSTRLAPAFFFPTLLPSFPPFSPAEAPVHRAIDVVGRVGDLGRDGSGIAERRFERVAQKVADFILAGEQRPDPDARVVYRLRLLERRQPRRLLRPIRHRRWIERQDLVAGAALLALVEALPGLLAGPAGLDQRGDERRPPHPEGARDTRPGAQPGAVHRLELV